MNLKARKTEIRWEQVDRRVMQVYGKTWEEI
jgi:hypothetical protein